MRRDEEVRRQPTAARGAGAAPTDDDLQPSEGESERVILLASALLVAAFWTAPLVGVPISAAAAGATLVFVALVAMLVREMRGKRRRRATERETLAELRLSRRRFKLLADHSADMIVESDRDMVRRYVSPASLTVLGYRPDELVGSSVMGVVDPEDVPAYRARIESLLDGTQDRVVTTQRYRRKDGRSVWTESHIQVVRHSVTGEPDGYVGSLRDITERHDAEAATRSSEAFLRGVIDASPDCIKVLDLDGQVSFMSRNGLCLLEFDRPDEPLGRDFAGLWPPATRPAVRSAIAASAAGATSRFRADCASAKGNPLKLDVVIAPVRDADGRPERLLVLSRDVSAGVAAEDALRRVRDRYRLLAENSSDVVMLREPGPDGAALYVSPSCARVLGCPPDEAADGCSSALIHPDDRAAVRSLLDRLGPEDGIRLHTYRVRRADGAFIWVEGAFQVAERAGEPTVVVALRDVTERQQRAEDLAAAKDMAERAQRAAEDASEAKSDFLAAMSHEIRTPLNSIIGFTDLMLDSGELPPGAARHAELIRAAGAALLTVVNDVLDFSKAEAGAVELEAIPFAPEALARGCADILRGYAGTKALDIEVEIGERLPGSLVGDEGRLRQVLLNLLNNAVKFTAHGRVVLRVSSLGASEAGGETVRFEVADTGIGIAEDKQHRLFERFSQVDSSVARRFGGSGLGLAICKRLVELMGGAIGVASREGEGSTFWFTVTLPPSAVDVAAPPQAPRVGAPRKARILVVEDIDINQRLAVALLEALGHAVDVVGDGAQAVAAVAAESYDLVLMDVQMPGMDGVTATRLIRGSEGPHRAVPIVAMTANVFPEQVRAFREAGMDGHLGKPLNRAQLHAAVARWTAGGARPAEPAPDDRAELPFDEAAYAQLGTYLGPARLDDVLARLVASLPQRFSGSSATAPEDVRRWKADAHVVLSVAGMAGLAELAARCRALEAAMPGSEGYAQGLAAVRLARDAAVQRVIALRRDLARREDAA
ncbi:PAS domain-containing hybrid sensor histidine kinase/response regulator [Lichenibacterium dinghuense]|uniref:PAS domain-containing hybrid sensor histidine kinase/response regulator n=1 Tax=Lichenibacterium dinghuense TaxID=2895977 RepID=UPI001F2EC158|nr:PAS domain S-box protein [Lichenibacterium sp. 6Y81]